MRHTQRLRAELTVDTESANDTAPASAGTVAIGRTGVPALRSPLLPHVRQGYLRTEQRSLARRRMTIPLDLAARIERLYTVEHWRVGTIARQLHVHRDTVRRVLREHGAAPPDVPLRPSLVDPTGSSSARRWRSTRR